MASNLSSMEDELFVKESTLNKSFFRSLIDTITPSGWKQWLLLLLIIALVAAVAYYFLYNRKANGSASGKGAPSDDGETEEERAAHIARLVTIAAQRGMTDDETVAFIKANTISFSAKRTSASNGDVRGGVARVDLADSNLLPRERVPSSIPVSLDPRDTDTETV